jgi:hypothetical protein
MLAEHVPHDGNIGAEDAAEWLENRVCAERDVVPSKVWATPTENDCKANGRYNASPVSMFSWVEI